MKLNDLKLGDILFYYNMKTQSINNINEHHYAVTHVSIVSHVNTCPWVSHITERGLIFNAIKMREHQYTGLRYLAYRLKYPQDSHFAKEASQLARMWCIANNNAILIEKKPPDNAAFNDTFLPAFSVPNTFSYLKSHSAVFRSASFGKRAINFINKLQRCKSENRIPVELTANSSMSSMFCSMFVVACYQSAFGVPFSADMLAVDAQTILPWTLHHYINKKASWKCLGEIDFYHPLPSFSSI